jgi:hypothetical protein
MMVHTARGHIMAAREEASAKIASPPAKMAAASSLEEGLEERRRDSVRERGAKARAPRSRQL